MTINDRDHVVAVIILAGFFVLLLAPPAWSASSDLRHRLYSRLRLGRWKASL